MDLLFILFIVLVIILALILLTCKLINIIRNAQARRAGVVSRAITHGGADTSYRAGAAGWHHDHGHHLGHAIHDYSREVFLNHQTAPSRSFAKSKLGSGDWVIVAGTRTNYSRPKWYEYDSWKDLHNDEQAVSDYFKQRESVLNNPNLNWAEVLKVVEPKLAENREYIGIVNLAPDGKTLILSRFEPSPTSASNEKASSGKFASIPNDFVAKIASKPGLILFHTHPNNENASPLPSSHDLSTAIYLGSASRYAACAVISRYGVLMHGLDWPAYTAMDTAEDWKLVALNLSFDVVSAHEAIRSWSQHTLDDYFKFYARHKLISFVFPSSDLVGDMRKNKWTWDIEAPTDFEIINEHINDIKEHIKKRNKSSKEINVSSLKFR
jgi:hypothetical protein